MENEKLHQESIAKKEREEDDNVSIWDCGSPLYDSFELASLCHHLDRHLMLLPFTKGSGRLTCRRSDEPDECSGKQMAVVSSERWRVKKEEIEKKKNRVGLKEIHRAIAFWRKY